MAIISSLQNSIYSLGNFLNSGYTFEVILLFLLFFAVIYVASSKMFKNNFVNIVIAASVSLLAIGFGTSSDIYILFTTYQFFGAIAIYLFSTIFLIYFIYLFEVGPFLKKAFLIFYLIFLFMIPRVAETYSYQEFYWINYIAIGITLFALIFDKWTQKFIDKVNKN